MVPEKTKNPVYVKNDYYLLDKGMSFVVNLLSYKSFVQLPTNLSVKLLLTKSFRYYYPVTLLLSMFLFRYFSFRSYFYLLLFFILSELHCRQTETFPNYLDCRPQRVTGPPTNCLPQDTPLYFTLDTKSPSKN